VTRFPVGRPRDERRFALYSDIVFRDFHTPEDERAWVLENGPLCPGLVRAVAERRDSYRYATTFQALPQVARRALLVPTAEDDGALRLSIFRDLFRAARALAYLTPEEQQLVEEAAGAHAGASAVVGSGLEIAAGYQDVDLAARFGLAGPYALYVGRVDWAKGVDRLADYWIKLAQEQPDLPPLLLAGRQQIELPAHPRLRLLGEVSEREKCALLAGSLLLLLPSALESLSISVLEAWALGRPVLVNAECRVLEGQCRRSNAGLFYRGYAEFAPALRLLLADAELRAGLGENGREYVRREYDWAIVERRVLDLLRQVAAPA
jgi:glycosyltransferase involved in cell wall biosynthesis